MLDFLRKARQFNLSLSWKLARRDIDGLIAAALNGAWPEREQAITALGKTGDPRAAAALRHILRAEIEAPEAVAGSLNTVGGLLEKLGSTPKPNPHAQLVETRRELERRRRIVEAALARLDVP